MLAIISTMNKVSKFLSTKTVLTIVVVVLVAIGAWLVWHFNFRQSTTTEKEPEPISRDTARAMYSMSGVLKEYDTEKDTIIVEADNKDQQKMRLTDSTSVARGMALEDASIRDIPIGTKISISYTGGDKVLSIWWDDADGSKATEEEGE